MPIECAQRAVCEERVERFRGFFVAETDTLPHTLPLEMSEV